MSEGLYDPRKPKTVEANWEQTKHYISFRSKRLFYMELLDTILRPLTFFFSLTAGFMVFLLSSSGSGEGFMFFLIGVEVVSYGAIILYFLVFFAIAYNYSKLTDSIKDIAHNEPDKHELIKKITTNYRLGALFHIFTFPTLFHFFLQQYSFYSVIPPLLLFAFLSSMFYMIGSKNLYKLMNTYSQNKRIYVPENKYQKFFKGHIIKTIGWFSIFAGFTVAFIMISIKEGISLMAGYLVPDNVYIVIFITVSVFFLCYLIAGVLIIKSFYNLSDDFMEVKRKKTEQEQLLTKAEEGEDELVFCPFCRNKISVKNEVCPFCEQVIMQTEV